MYINPPHPTTAAHRSQTRLKIRCSPKKSPSNLLFSDYVQIRLHTAANLPIGMEFLQEARSKEGSTLVSSSNIFQKLRSEATTRIEKEMSEDLAPERECGVWLSMPAASGAPLRATILGPEGSPYEGGRFEVEITVPRSYPFVSPKCRFLTKIWHPNVDHKTGEVCLVDIPPSLLLIKILIHYQVESIWWTCNHAKYFCRVYSPTPMWTTQWTLT